MLQGLNDSMVDPQAALAFALRPDARARVQLITYAGLGHTLGLASSAQEDGLPSVAKKPLDDIADWLSRNLR